MYGADITVEENYVVLALAHELVKSQSRIRLNSRTSLFDAPHEQSQIVASLLSAEDRTDIQRMWKTSLNHCQENLKSEIKDEKPKGILFSTCSQHHMCGIIQVKRHIKYFEILDLMSDRCMSNFPTHMLWQFHWIVDNSKKQSQVDLFHVLKLFMKH
ncbi:CLUMA_CG004200, isoform A [Clunio marinus]|uniref:CLUMA_CG004200, isoform A n=1 Tax=Clunio marinus TaxID=568069 RepID=A0A1J1HR07_9DIPT|nr:CLUMA_CG004200, isoform A [Clunio marinus]